MPIDPKLIKNMPSRTVPANNAKGTWRVFIAIRMRSGTYKTSDKYNYDYPLMNSGSAILLEDAQELHEYLNKVMPLIGESGLNYRILIKP